MSGWSHSFIEGESYSGMLFPCSICGDTLREPCTASCMRHNYCWECLAAWVEQQGAASTCPECRQPIQKRVEDLVINSGLQAAIDMHGGRHGNTPRISARAAKGSRQSPGQSSSSAGHGCGATAPASSSSTGRTISASARSAAAAASSNAPLHLYADEVAMIRALGIPDSVDTDTVLAALLDADGDVEIAATRLLAMIARLEAHSGRSPPRRSSSSALAYPVASSPPARALAAGEEVDVDDSSSDNPSLSMRRLEDLMADAALFLPGLFR